MSCIISHLCLIRASLCSATIVSRKMASANAIRVNNLELSSSILPVVFYVLDVIKCAFSLRSAMVKSVRLHPANAVCVLLGPLGRNLHINKSISPASVQVLGMAKKNPKNKYMLKKICLVLFCMWL